MRDGWKIKTLGDIGKVSMCKRILKKQTSETGGIPFYKIGTFGKKANAFIPKELYEEFRSKYSFPKKGDVLISASGTIGRRVVFDGKPAYFQDSNIVWIDNDETQVLNEYLYTFYGHCDWNPSKGATISRLYNDDLRRIPIPIPPLPEQKAIVKILDEAFAKIDQAKANIEKNIENAKELFQSKLNEIFSQRGEGWEEKTILDLCSHKSQIVGGPFGSNLKVKDYKESGVPILRLQNIGKGYFIDKAIKYISEDKAEELSYHSFKSGDIVLAKLGIPIGKTCIVPIKFEYGIVVADVVRIRPNNELVNYDFLKHFLNSDNAVGQLTADIRGATRPRVNIKEVRNLKLSIPSLAKQKDVATQIDKIEQIRNRAISNYTTKIDSLIELKKSLLKEAFSGELTKTEVTE